MFSHSWKSRGRVHIRNDKIHLLRCPFSRILWTLLSSVCRLNPWESDEMTVGTEHMTVFTERTTERSYLKETVPENRRNVISDFISKYVLYSHWHKLHKRAMLDPITDSGVGLFLTVNQCPGRKSSIGCW